MSAPSNYLISDEEKAALKAAEREQIQALLSERAYNPNEEPPIVQPVFTLDGIPISTPGNLSTVISAIKTGKSTVVANMLAAAMPGANRFDTLGFASSNEEGNAVLHFDTEQSKEDHWRLVTAALRRVRCDSPEWLQSWCLTGVPARTAWQAIQMVIDDAVVPIHSVLIDGVADLVVDVNDAGECNAFVGELHGLAIKHACPIIGVIHLNPGSEKSRGHLGSQLERKAETNLQLTKEGEVTSIWSTKQRRAPIPKERAVRFRWSEEHGMHVRCTEAEALFPAEKIEQFRMQAEDVFNGRRAMRYTEIVAALITAKMAERTAQRRVGEWLKATVISKSVANLYTLNVQ